MVNRYLKLVFLVALVVAAIRLVVVGASTESGWGLIATQWQDAVLSLVGQEYKTIGDRAPAEQTDFWLSEVDRILGKQPDSASLYMGAAWVLDSPGTGFTQYYVRQNEFGQHFPQFALELDRKAVDLAKKAFKQKCTRQCVELSGRATQLEPTNIDLWRMRALLLFEADGGWNDPNLSPRIADYLPILDECQKHDPENALYDYLAVLHLWNQSATYELPDGGVRFILKVNDEEAYKIAVDRFLLAQTKPFLAIGEAGYPSIVEFLHNSKAYRNEQAEVAISRLVTFRHGLLFGDLLRWQEARAEFAKAHNDQPEQSQILAQNLRLFDQATVPKETSALNILTSFGIMRRSFYQALQELVKTDPTIMSSNQLAELAQREEQYRIEAATLTAALQNLSQTTYPVKNAAEWPTFFTSVIAKSFMALVVTAGVFLAIGRLLSRRLENPLQLDLWQHLLAWIVGCGITFVVLGMAPAEMINQKVQRITAIVCIWIVALLLTAVSVWLVVTLLQLRKLRFRVITLLATMTGVAVFASLWPLMEMWFAKIANYSPDLWMPAKGWYGIDAEVLRNVMKLQTGTWTWAAIQWFVYGGVYISLVLSMLLLITWTMWREARCSQEGLIRFWSQEIRPRWGQLCHFAGSSALWAAGCFFLLYLLAIPRTVQLAEANFQHQMRYCRNPLVHWQEIRDSQLAIESSATEMAIIRQQVEAEFQSEGEQEMDFTDDH